MGITNLSFRTKLLILGTMLTGAPLVLLGGAVWWQNSHFHEAASSGNARLAQSDLDHIAQSVYALCETARAGLEHSVAENLHAATVVLEQSGNFHQESRTMVTWKAQNQLTKVSSTISLPKALVGRTWLGRARDLQATVPVVDAVRKLTGATSTIFQRMNAAGDMLRVATNVVGNDGQRAIGTFIPAIGPDGQPTPVIATVLRGETFIGRAFVVNAWYMAAYQPLRDAGNNIIGMLYVGVPERIATEPLRRAIMNIQIARTGYVYVVNATGAARGHYVVSKNGTRDGEDVWDAKDNSGRLFVQEICRKALSLRPGEVASEQYPWRNPGEPEVYDKIAHFAYFRPWDWVVSASVPEKEFYEGTAAIDRIAGREARVLLAIGLAALAVTCLACFLLARHLTRHTDRIVHEIGEVSQSMSAAAADISENSERLAHDSTQQSTSVEQMSASIQQLESMTRRNLDDSRALAQLAAETRGSAEIGARQVQTLNETMSQIQLAGADVVKINKLIDEIAFQTNILALNAAVEAARAGEAGLGFAVVADEVRNLARRCAQAAQDTSGKIQKSMAAGQHGVSATKELADKLSLIATSSRKLDEHVQSVARGSNEQTQGIAQIVTAVNVMTRGTQASAANATEGFHRAQQFNAQARALAGLAAEISEIFRTAERPAGSRAVGQAITTKKIARQIRPSNEDLRFSNFVPTQGCRASLVCPVLSPRLRDQRRGRLRCSEY